MINRQTLFQRSSVVLASDLSHSIVLMNLQKGSYLSLNETAAEIWRALEHPGSGAELTRHLCTKFLVDEAQCEEKVDRFLETLLRHEVITPLVTAQEMQ